MPSLKDVKTKISAVKKTQQITKAMNMVATSRLRGCQMRMEGFRSYADKFSEVLGSLAEKSGEEANELIMPREQVNNIHIVLCTSDRGLCGGFNANLIDKASKFIADPSLNGMEFTFTGFGKKGLNWCRKKKQNVTDAYLDIVGKRIPFHVASTAGRKLVDAYLEGTYDEVYIIYPEFLNVGRQIPVMKKLLPIPPIESKSGKDEHTEDRTFYLAEHICEPPPEELLSLLLPKNVFVQIYRALLETSTSEHAARMTAMDNATKACKDIIENLTVLYNKARQSAITAELMDIVGGAEALRG